ncbi:MAG: hypothetical protein J7623_12320 [Chitinophaga sp.]|uniref:hypothetical protein n=1 Tax=Chitinophaga sp. TaxID=1869181 RepID=UPI001B2DC099|nr:hypothetical protein [Chitinophaga sp.]MBO9729412.1 hypothetical protein [Chitinophaga sp.]
MHSECSSNKYEQVADGPHYIVNADPIIQWCGDFPAFLPTQVANLTSTLAMIV